MFLLHSCFLGFYVAVWNLSWEIQGLQGAGDFFFFFFLSLSLSLFTSLCLSASLYSAVKTPQPPSHGCHSNHLPALTSYVSVRAFVYVSAGKSACALRDVTYWKSVRWLLVLPPWGFSLIRGCLCYTKLHTHNHTHTTTHLCTRTSTHTHTREASCVLKSDVL